MGIRVHKFLGYGLTDLKTADGKLADERVNAESWLLTKEQVPQSAEYRAWLERLPRESPPRISLDLAALKGTWPVKKSRDLDDCCAWRPGDGGLPEVLVLQPYALERWYRFDDDIDWVTESYLLPGEGVRVPVHKEQQDHCAVLPNGPHPFNGVFMDARTGDWFDDRIMWWLRAWNGLKSRGPVTPEREALLDELAREAGLSGHAEAVQAVVPQVPREIQDLAEFGRLFTHAAVWRQLRPVLYTYWC